MDYGAYKYIDRCNIIWRCRELSLKYGMSQRPDFRVKELLSLATNLPVVAGFMAYGLSTLLYFKVLVSLDFSLAYPTVSLGYVLVVLFSKIFFNEPVSKARWAAVFVICLGVALVGFAGV